MVLHQELLQTESTSSIYGNYFLVAFISKIRSRCQSYKPMTVTIQKIAVLKSEKRKCLSE